MQKPICEVDIFGNKFYKNYKGEFHREDGPSIEYNDGTKLWYKNNQLHRENGPGEAREADIGIAFGKQTGLLFKHGKPVCKISAQETSSILLKEMAEG